MSESLLYVGIDVDDKAYHISIYNALESTSFDFKCGPSPQLLIRAFKKHNVDLTKITVCYEATYIGFSLFRALKESKIRCEIAAPSLIPKQPGMAQKTDKIDAKK